MATVIRRKGSPNWFARFRLGGKDYTITTKEKNKDKALEAMRRMVQERSGTLSVEEVFKTVLRELRRLEDQSTDDPQRLAVLRTLRHGMARRLLSEQREKVELADAWAAWLDNPKKRNPGPVTIRQYESEWQRFMKWTAGKDVSFLHEVTPAMAEDYAADLWRSKVSPSTYNQHVTFLKSLFRVLKIKAGLVTNPWDEIPMLPLEQEGRRMLTADELAEVCKAAKGSLRYLVGLGLYSGMRLGDAVNLRWDAVKFEEGIIELMPMKTRRMNKVVRLPIHPVLEALLKELRAVSKGEYLFPEERELYQKDRSDITDRFQALLTSRGIVTTEPVNDRHRRREIIRVGFHSLRHSFVSLCAANRVPQVAIMELVGHGSPAMTALYSHSGDEQKTKAIAALPAFAFEGGRKRKRRRQDDKADGAKAE